MNQRQKAVNEMSCEPSLIFYVGFCDNGYEEINEWEYVPNVRYTNFTIPGSIIPPYKTNCKEWFYLNIITLKLLENKFDIMSIGMAIVKFAERYNGKNLWIKVNTPLGFDVFFKARPIGFAYHPDCATNTNFIFKLQMISEPVTNRGKANEPTSESADTQTE